MKTARNGTAESLREQVYQHLENALREGRLNYGTWLDQARLCAELGISRTPLREALLRLEAEGFVAIHPRRGVYLNPVSNAFVRSACQLAGALEADCLDAVFSRITPQIIRRLEAALHEQQHCLERNDMNGFHGADARFHALFISLSENPLINRAIAPLRRRLDALPEHPMTLSLAQAALSDHQRIIESIRRGNRIAAVSILRHEHWSPSRFLAPRKTSGASNAA